jgi:hypothetical protein
MTGAIFLLVDAYSGMLVDASNSLSRALAFMQCWQKKVRVDICLVAFYIIGLLVDSQNYAMIVYYKF